MIKLQNDVKALKISQYLFSVFGQIAIREKGYL
jgi:hypothetical protein